MALPSSDGVARVSAQRLLGHLAEFSSLFRQGELLCTQGLAYLLQNLEAQATFAAWLCLRTGDSVECPHTWKAEQVQLDRGRPDLEALAADGRPLVKIEAKLTAGLIGEQFRSYCEDLHVRSGRGLLLVLVPRYRAEEAAGVVRGQFALAGDGPWHIPDLPGCVLLVVTWKDVLEALNEVGDATFSDDLAQFRAMYGVLSGDDAGSLGPEEIRKWRDREDYFANIVDRVTRELSRGHPLLMPPGNRLFPLFLEPATQFRHRYVGPLPDSGAHFSVGMRDPFEGHLTPVWMRFNFSTPHFAEVRANLEGSDLRQSLVYSGKHVWIPLDVPVGGDQPVVDALLGQAQGVIQLAYRGFPGFPAKTGSGGRSARSAARTPF